MGGITPRNQPIKPREPVNWRANCAESLAFDMPGNRTIKTAKVRDTSKAVKDRLKALHRARRKHMIKPENADPIIAEILQAEPDDILHCVVMGNFVFGDMIERLAARLGRLGFCGITTLSMNPRNVESLARIQADEMIVMVSTYWIRTDKRRCHEILRDALGHRATLRGFKNHTKLAILRGSRDVVIAGSANLRSSDCIEQFTVNFGSDEADFYAAWMRDMATQGVEL